MNERQRQLAQRVRSIANNRRRSGRNRQPLVKGTTEALNYLKYEMASELGLVDRINEVGYENMTTKECGSIGGMMTKRMIAYAQIKMREELDENGSLNDLPMFDAEQQRWNYHPKTFSITQGRGEPVTHEEAYDESPNLH